MQIENLARANELDKQIKECKTHIKKWENCVGLRDDVGAVFNKEMSSYSYVTIRGIPFNVLKACSLQFYKELLSDLEQEFESLK